MADGQEQQFQLGFRTVFRSASDPGDRTNLFVDGCVGDACNVRAAGVAPEGIKSLAFDFTAEQRTHAGACEPESNPIEEVGRQHESVTEYVADGCRIDFGARRRVTLAALAVPIVE